MSKTEKKSKLVRYEKRMYNGEHANYKGTYDYNVEFENNDQCITGKKNPDATFKIGEEYNYLYEERQVTPNWLKKSATQMMTDGEKASKENYDKGGSSGGHQKTPGDQKRIQAQVALIASNSIMNKIQDDHDIIVREFLSWLILTGTGDNIITAQGCLKISSEYWREVPVEQVTIKSVIDKANDFLNAVNKSARWDGIINRETSQPSSKESEKNMQPQHEVDPAKDPMYMNDQLDQAGKQESDLAKKDEENESPFMKIL